MGYGSTSMFVYCLAAIVCHSVTSQQNTGVILLWQGIQYPNNSILNIEAVGEGKHSLICQTDKRPCCGTRPYRFGEWYYPDGRRVPTLGEGESFYRDRYDEGIVRLNRRAGNNYTTYPGLFYCELPDANGMNQILYVELLSRDSVGGVPIIGLSYNATHFSLSCVTSGRLATFVNGDDCNCEQQLVGFSQLVLDPAAMTYNNVLRWGSQSQGHYVCSVRNRMATSYAVLLTKFAVGQGSCSSQITGTLGHNLTLLCLANDPVKDAVWITGGVRNSNNITFTNLSESDAGEYICRGTIQDQTISSLINLRISKCSAVVYISGNPAVVNIGQSYNLTCNTFYWETGCTEDEYYLFHGNELISRNKSLTFRADSVSGVLTYFLCVVTLNGSNFTSNPTSIPTIQLPSPTSVSISSDMDNPIPYGSSPTLTCMVSLSPAIDVEVEIIVEWSGQTYGLRKYTTTPPVLNSSAEVPIYTSSARLDATGTFYDSGQYYCSVVLNSLTNRDVIRSTSAISSPQISVLYLAPRRPSLHSINQVGHNWIYISWDRNSDADNVTNYEVRYSYTGECSEISRDTHTQILDGSDMSYNITDLGGHLSYSINLTAINDTGSSPPNIAFAVTRSAPPKGAPTMFTATLAHSTNITMQWQRVMCSERNSEITHYDLQYGLEGSGIGTEPMSKTNDSNRMYTAIRLQPLSRYTFTIAAVNSDGQTGPDTTVTVTTTAPESVVFQIQLNGVHSCLQWRISDPEDKVHDILVGIASGVNQHCPYCEIEHTNITDGEFQCFPGSPNQVTFRAKVHDRAQATAREVIMYIEQWITSSDVVTIPIHHARLIINNTCVVLLASLDDPECLGYLIPPSTSPPVYTTTSGTSGTSDTMPYVSTDTDPITQLMTTAQLTTGTSNKNQNKGETLSPVDMRQPQLDTGAIVGGAVAIVFIITTGVVIMFLLYSILKYHHTKGQSTPKKFDESPHKITAKPATAAEEDEVDETYEVIEMQVTSSAKSRYAPAQTPQEGTITHPVESEAKKDSTACEESQEELGDNAYMYEL